jgi:3'-phosphoadenosine 5'-phosphosulfate sulfotransferase (PAPS reductase)/FAD synthetase
MKHIVQFSGGAASSYVAWLIAQKEKKEDITLLFHDTKIEHEDATRFRTQVADFIGLPITEISDGRDLWELIDYNNALPSSFIPFCTRVQQKSIISNWRRQEKNLFYIMVLGMKNTEEFKEALPGLKV